MDGSIVRFLEDLWYGDSYLKNRFPGLTKLYPLQNVHINKFAFHSSSTHGQIDQDFRFPRNLTMRDVNEASDLLAVLDLLKLWEGIWERRVQLDDDGFTVKIYGC